jgi:TolB-like protein/Flp pilus assembly protein TadD
MSLTNREMARLGELLDEVLPLTLEQRSAWLDSLSSGDLPLLRTLRVALLAGETEAGGPLDRPPRIAGDSAEEEGAAGRHAGEQFGAYELLRPLGSGGMADVWLARRTDGAFERQVALKIPRLQSRPVVMTARFALECNILAALEYPGIARLYDAGVDDSGVPYIAMEYVQGDPLVAWCDAHELAEAARLQVFLQVLDAVAYAHGRQVVHRDLKPSNILVTGQGEVRLLDFGVARLLQPKTDDALLTRDHGLAVTPEYASPELLRGESIDARSDLYSLGVVLHELLTGARPAQTARPATGGTKRLHGALGDVVTKALQPDPGDRYTDAMSFAGALRPFADGRAHDLPWRLKTRPLWVAGLAALAALVAIAVGALAPGHFVIMRTETPPALPAAETTSIAAPSSASAAGRVEGIGLAVLPFVNMSSDPEQEHFADGLTEELLTWLANVEGFNVPGRTTSFALKGEAEDLRDIGARLGVKYLLEGSVRRSGDAMRITAQLIEADTGYHLWSETFDRTLDDIFAIQDEVAGHVVTELLGAIPESDMENPAAAGDVDPNAHEHYLKGRALWAQRSIDAAFTKFREAVAIDPNHYLAQAYLAVAGVFAIRHGFPLLLRESESAHEVVNAALQKAVALKPDAADVLFARGWALEHESKAEFVSLGVPPTAALDFYKRALRANPRHVEAMHALARGVQNSDDRIAFYERVIEIDPGHVVAASNLARAYVGRGDGTAAALALFQRIFTIAPQTPPGHAAGALIIIGEFEAGAEYLLRNYGQPEPDDFSRNLRAIALASLGALDEARFLFEKEATTVADPVRRISSRMEAFVLARDLDGQLAVANDITAHEVWPDWIHDLAVRAHLNRGEPQRALDMIVEKEPDGVDGLIRRSGISIFYDPSRYAAAIALDRLGRRDEARRIWNVLLAPVEFFEGRVWDAQVRYAVIYAWLGDRERALAELKSAYDMGFRLLYGFDCGACADDSFVNENGWLEPLFGDPRFDAFVQKIRRENAEALRRLDGRYGFLAKIRAEMAAEEANAQ